MTQFNLMESWKIVSKHTMSKEKGYGTKAIASVPYPSIFLFSSGTCVPAPFR